MEDKDLIRDIHQNVIKLVEQGARHNEILATHESRSTTLQKMYENVSNRLSPIEKHVNLVSLILKALGAVVIALVIQALARAIF